MIDDERPTSDEQTSINHPYARCNRHNELVFIPNCDANSTREHLSQQNSHIEGALIGAYIRSTIKREAAIKARKGKICKCENCESLVGVLEAPHQREYLQIVT